MNIWPIWTYEAVYDVVYGVWWTTKLCRCFMYALASGCSMRCKRDWHRQKVVVYIVTSYHIPSQTIMIWWKSVRIVAVSGGYEQNVWLLRPTSQATICLCSSRFVCLFFPSSLFVPVLVYSRPYLLLRYRRWLTYSCVWRSFVVASMLGDRMHFRLRV